MKIQHITTAIQFPNLQVRKFFDDLQTAMKGGISFGTGINTEDKNIQGTTIEIANTGAANTSVTLQHNLGYVPKFIDFKYKSVAGDLYDAGTAWTKTQAFVKFSTANMHVRVFVH